MSRTTTGNNTGVFYKDVISTGALYINGRLFKDYIDELVFEDQFEQEEIAELKQLVQYLNTSGLSSEWIVDNNNKNQDLKTLITALQTKLANIDTTALTETSVLTNDNRNSVLKSALDTATSDLTSLTTRVTTAETDIDNLETKTRFITEASIVGTGNNTLTNFKTKVGPAGGEAQGIVFVEHNMKNAPSGELIGYSMASNFTVTSNENFGSNESFYSHYDGRLTIGPAHTIRVQATDQVRIGTFADRDAFSEMDIKIGGRGNKVNIGSVDSQNATGPITEVWIGHDGGTTGRNTETSLEGNLYIGNGYFPQLPKSDKFTWTQLGAYIKTAGLPAWVVSFALTSSIPNFEYSDCWVMKDGSTGSNKKGDVTTSNDTKLKTLVIYNSSLNIARLTPVEGTFVGSGTISKTTLNGSIRNSCFLDGGGDNKIAFKHHNIAASDIVDWATTEANDKCNVIEIGGNSGILIHQGASNSETPLQIINSKSGPIKMLLNNDGTRGGAISGVEIRPYETGGVFGSQTRVGFYPLADPTGSQQLEINQPLNRDGIVVQYYTYPAGAIKNIINYNSINTQGTITGIDLVGSSSVSTPSLVISGNYTGDTTNRLYKNADNKLFWNGVELGANLGGGGGGLEYYIPLANNVTNPAPNPTTQIATETYTNAPQRTITQSTTAVATGLRMARYLTGLIDKESNPFVEGLQTIQQYLTWSENNIVGQLYGQAWFQAEATGAGAFVYERIYSGGVQSAGVQVLNGTPIPAPNGLFNLSVKSVVFPGIFIDTFSGLTMTLKCRLEARDLITENWNILQTSTSSISYSVDNQYNQTLTFTEDFIHNQTTKTNAPTAYRFVLFVSSASNTGAFVQTGAGSTGSDLGAYKLGSVAGGTASIRVLLYDGENAKQTITHTTTPSLVPIELPISPLYEIGAFNNGRLGFDVFMYQPSGAVNANHQMKFFFGEGTISHIESTSSIPDPIPTLAQILNSGATASQTINMNGNAITGITTLEGSSNGNWNVKEISAGTGVSVSPTSGTYTIANTGVLSVASVSGSGISVSTSNGAVSLANTGVLSVASASGSGISVSTSNGVATLANTGVLSVASASGSGISVSTANGVATLQNTGILSITAGTGISVSTTSGVAQITSTVTGTTQSSVLQNIRDDNQALVEIGAEWKKPNYWLKNWTISNSSQKQHSDIYVSADGKIVICGAGYASLMSSRDYGVTFNTLTNAVTYTAVCGTSTGSKLYAFGHEIVNATQQILLYTSVDYGNNWTYYNTPPAFFAGISLVNKVRCSGDGKYVIATEATSSGINKIIFSSDFGATFTYRELLTNIGNTYGVCMSASGANQFVIGQNIRGDAQASSKIYRSFDYGATFQVVQDHLGGGVYWKNIDCDATGRFVWATRYFDQFVDATVYTSSDYGTTWKQAPISGAIDIKVSGSGQFVMAIKNPSAESLSFAVMSQDYGNQFDGYFVAENLFSCIGANKDFTNVFLGSKTAGTVPPSDGKLRVARTGHQNLNDLIVAGKGTIETLGGVYTLTVLNDYELVAVGTLTGNVSTYNLDWDIANKINLETHNIKYEIFISYNYRATQLTDDAYFQIGLNGVHSTQIGPSPSDNRRRPAVTNWTDVIVSNWNQGTSVYNQSFIDRFYCGYRPTSTWSEQFRNRVHLNGEISMNRRLNPEPDFSYSTNSRIIVNQFHCETFVDAGATTDWYVYVENGSNNAEQYNRINGTAIWNARAGNLYEDYLETGISAINIVQQNLTDPLLSRPRPAEVRYRIWKVKKNI